MKIAIITVYNSMNFGSYLQAYALCSFFQQKGHEVVFPNWNKGDCTIWNAVKPILLSRDIGVRGIGAGVGRAHAFKNNRCKLPESILTDLSEYDLTVIGSDTLWDIARDKFRDPILYGGLNNSRQIISYAVSCSNSDYADFVNRHEFVNCLKNIKYVSVRDSHTYEVIKRVTNIEPATVCDPTLLVETETWRVGDVKEDLTNAIVVYAYSLPDHIVKVLNNYAKKKGLRLVSLCMFHAWCNQHINCDPLDFPSYVHDSHLFVTNTFHGSIFSIITQAHYVPIHNGYKLQCLLNDFFGTDISLPIDVSDETFEAFVEEELDYSLAHDRIKLLKEESQKWVLEHMR